MHFTMDQVDHSLMYAAVNLADKRPVLVSSPQVLRKFFLPLTLYVKARDIYQSMVKTFNVTHPLDVTNFDCYFWRDEHLCRLTGRKEPYEKDEKVAIPYIDSTDFPIPFEKNECMFTVQLPNRTFEVLKLPATESLNALHAVTVTVWYMYTKLKMEERKFTNLNDYMNRQHKKLVRYMASQNPDNVDLAIEAAGV